MNWYKYSQLYSEEVARTTTDPKILIDILRRGNNDWVSYYAAQNPNCPPEILAEVLRRGNDDGVSYYAVENPNCPPEILAEVLGRGNNDELSYYAIRHSNCPPEAKFKWFRDIGKITKYDPKKHIKEFESKEVVDEDLKKLEELVSESKFNFKKYAKEREFPVAAVVIADGKIFEGKSHLEAIQKAIKAGYAHKTKDGYLEDRAGKDMTFSGATDLFRTNKGRIIDRFEAFALGEATASENIPEKELSVQE
jgi:hypothetical protein